MNLYGLIILAALIGKWMIEFVADVLDLRAFPHEVPYELKDTYTREDLEKARRYARHTTILDWVCGTTNLVLLIGFWQFGGFAWLNKGIGALTGGSFANNAVCRGLLFVSALFVLKKAVSIPFDLYDTFVLEEKFGFNRTTPRTFVADNVKSLVLGITIGWPILALVIWFFDAFEGYAWLLCWLVVVLFSLAIHYIAPTWILPLFNRFTPLEDGSLRSRICAFAEKVGFPLAGVFVIDGSRRTTKANAFFTGFGGNKRIALYDTLIEKYSEDQLVAILAHEIGHYKKHHIHVNFVLGMLHAGLMFLLLGIFLKSEGLFAAFGFAEQPVYAGLVFFALLFSPLNLVVGIILNALSRQMEYDADRFARQQTGEPEALADALKLLSRDSLSELKPHPLQVYLHYSHPPILERLASLRS